MRILLYVCQAAILLAIFFLTHPATFLHALLLTGLLLAFMGTNMLQAYLALRPLFRSWNV